MKTLKFLAIVLIILGVVIALVPQNRTKQYKLSPQQMLDEINSGSNFISPDEVADKIINKDPSIQLIDVRTPAEFVNYSLPNAINIPLHSILLDKYVETLNQEEKLNIYYSNGNTEALQAWMLTRQLGYNNIFVLQGGVNYWYDKILNPVKPANVFANDEIAKYEFRKGVSSALGGATPLVSSTSSENGSSGVKIPTTGAKKKKVQGGC